MRAEFFLPTEEPWACTFPGGFVRVLISNELSSEKDRFRISFFGTTNYGLTFDGKRFNKVDEFSYFMEALNMVHNIPKPISIWHLKKLGFKEV